MSEEENIEYRSGDVVWVKLGTFWWPGEVTDQGPEDVSTTTKKPPVAIVKFFGEDNYEYVMNHKGIYPYNCERKHEFIKKGMDSYRGKNPQVEKFPLDINTAETKTDGNVNILFDIYSQQKKTNVVAEVFGTPTPKKSTKNGPHRHRFKKSSSIKKQKASAAKIAKGITHRRFLGCDDYEMRIRVQYPGKDVEPNDSDEDHLPINEDDTKKFPCSTCGFITDRLEVMLFHVQCHIKGIVTPATSITKKKKSPKKPRKIIHEIQLSDDGDNVDEHDRHTLSSIDSEEDIIKRKQKRKRKSQGSGKIKQKKIIDEKSTVDIRTNLLAEWSDSEDNIDQDNTETSKLNTSSSDSIDDSIIKQNNDKLLTNDTKKADPKDENKSCFDFEEDDDDEDSNSIVQTTVSGRKIPRVIPPNDRRKSTDPDNENASLPLAEDDETRVGYLNKANNNNNNNNNESSMNESSSSNINDESNSTKETTEFKDLMESTTVPELPEIPATDTTNNSKTQSVPAIKLPDKPKVDNSTEVATRLTNPKKRFVKSFEDFELLLNEQKKAMEEVEVPVEKTDEKDETKNKEQEVESEQKKEDTEKVKEKSNQIVEPEKDEIKDGKGETQDKKEETKEDDLKTDEKEETKKDDLKTDKKEETKKDDLKTDRKEETKKDDLKTDKKEDSEKDDKRKIEPEKTVPPEIETKLEISKFKCQIMSKITDEEQLQQQQQQQQQKQQQHESTKVKTKSSHRTPRSKILESYRNDTTNEKKRRKSIEEKKGDLSSDANKQRHDKHTPKKSRYLRSSTEEEKQQIEEVAKIEQKTAKETVGEDKNKVEEVKVVVETDKPAEIVVEEDKKSDSIQETNDSSDTSASVEIGEKPVDQDDDKNEHLFKLDEKDDNNETVISDKDIVEDYQSSTEVDIKSDTDDKPTEEVPLKTSLVNDEEMSALTTLATISQLQTTFDDSNKSDKIEIDTVQPTTSSSSPSFDEQFINKTIPPTESELITIDRNLTVVSEKDLAAGQVEITTKPVTLTTFSMDFSESTNDSSSNNENIETSKVDDESQKIDNKTKEDETEAIDKTKESVIEIPAVTKTPPVLDDEICDVEEHIPSSQIVCTQESSGGNVIRDDKLKTSEKNQSKLLLERLTTISTTITKDSIKSTKPKVQSLLTTNEPKVPIITKDVSSKISATTPATTTTIMASTTSTILTTKPIIKQLPSKIQTKVSSPKAIILSEQIIKSENPVIGENANTVSVQKISSKRNMQDPDEIDTFIIHKSKTVSDEQNIEENDLNKKTRKTIHIDPKKLQMPISTTKKRGKAKILQQTIITPSGEIVQPSIPTTQNQTQQQQQQNDENVFDINSMPIVLSDQILTPESIENMPIFLSDSTQSGTEIVTTTPTTKLLTTNVIKKPTTQLQQSQQQMKILNKTMIPSSSSSVVGTVVDKTPKIVKTTKLVSPVGSKLIKSNSFTPNVGTSGSNSSNKGKFVIVSQAASVTSTPTTTSKYTVGKKHIIKRPASEITGTLTKVQNVTSEPSGNKIMILTNQQGQQQRVLLTPAQQKLMGYQTPGAKVTKTLVKGNIIQKTATPGSSGLLTKTVVQSPTTTQRITTGQTLITSSGQVLTPISSKQVRIEKQQPTLQRKIPIQSQKVNIKGPPQQKTILIKNQHGQTVRKIQGTDEELLNQQVKEQIEAIKASGGLAQPLQLQQQQQQQQKPEITFKGNTKTIRRSYAKKTIESPKITTKSITTSATISNNKTESVIPPLTPISPKKSETTTVVGKEKLSVTQQQTEINKQSEQQRPLNQLVIQDAMGNQTTITEGQILALPSETVDGQPQSYMLVTLDESGNLTPLNNEALMSLDPNLGLGADIGNTVLQIDQNALKDNQIQSENVEISKTTVETAPTTITKTVDETTKVAEQIVETTPQTQQQEQQITTEPTTTGLQTVNCSVSSDGNGGQQLIVTGDPIAAQKFLESLTDGNADLANILMNAEGSILVHADGQQILINTDTDNQMLLSLGETSGEGGGNPIFATQPSKNQDILAAALADTDVFQQEQNSQQGGNVLETSLTLNSPIMTPLEVPSTNSKKIITDENDILTTQVPKNVDLPITITDPNISQTVAQQQVATMMVNELQNNLELTLPDTSTISSVVTSSEMNSPSSSFVYSLPNLDESVDINQKPFNSSMPLLTEDAEETTTTTTETTDEKDTKIDEKASKSEEDAKSDDKTDETTTPVTESTTTISTTSVESATTTTTSPITTTTTSTSSVGNFFSDNGLCSLGGEMCSSLSEPPPDMFDLSAVLSSDIKTDDTETKIEKNDADVDDNKQEIVDEKKEDSPKDQQTKTDKTTTETTNSPNSMNEDDSCEIPVQPEIVTNLVDVNQDVEINKTTDDKDGNDEKM